MLTPSCVPGAGMMGSLSAGQLVVVNGQTYAVAASPMPAGAVAGSPMAAAGSPTAFGMAGSPTYAAAGADPYAAMYAAVGSPTAYAGYAAPGSPSAGAAGVAGLTAAMGNMAVQGGEQQAYGYGQAGPAASLYQAPGECAVLLLWPL
jgi:hypothetical protein